MDLFAFGDDLVRVQVDDELGADVAGAFINVDVVDVGHAVVDGVDQGLVAVLGG